MDEALKGPYAAEWKKALDEEYNTMMKQDTWKLVELLAGKQVLSVKWILCIKTKGDRSMERFKARIVARRFIQEPREDFYNTYVPARDYTSKDEGLFTSENLHAKDGNEREKHAWPLRASHFHFP